MKRELREMISRVTNIPAEQTQSIEGIWGKVPMRVPEFYGANLPVTMVLFSPRPQIILRRVELRTHAN